MADPKQLSAAERAELNALDEKAQALYLEADAHYQRELADEQWGWAAAAADAFDESDDGRRYQELQDRFLEYGGENAPTQPTHPTPSLNAINNEIGFHLRALHALALRKREAVLDGVEAGEAQAYIDAAAESLYSEGVDDEWVPDAMWEYLVAEEIECILEAEAEERAKGGEAAR